MGQQSQKETQPHEYKTDTDFNTFIIPEKFKQELDEQVTDHNERVLSCYGHTNSKALEMVSVLKFSDFEGNIQATPDALSELGSLFYAAAMSKSLRNGDYECLKDWKDVDFTDTKFSAVERRRLVNDLLKCGYKKTQLEITDPTLSNDWDRVTDYSNLCEEVGSLKNFRHYFAILKNEQHGKNGELLEDNYQIEDFTADDRGKLDQLVTNLKLEKTMGTVIHHGDSIVQLPPSFHLFASQLMGSYCRRSVLDCFQKKYKTKTEDEALDKASIFELQTCLYQSTCFSKLGIWLSEKMEADKLKQQ